MHANRHELILKNEVYAIIPVGLIINFKKPSLEWERIILSQ